MKKTEVLNTLSRTVHKVGFQLKKHSPEILVVGGIIGTVASGVMACKATLKVNDVLEETKENVEKIHEATETGITQSGVEYTLEDSKKDLTTVYVQTGFKIAKLYAPAVILGTLSIGAMLTSNNILRKRNVALAAAYTAIDKSFKEYRGRVVERFGEDLEREIRYNIKAKEIEETVVSEDGTETIVKKTVPAIDPSIHSDYAKFFDRYCVNWQKDPELNLSFLKGQQAWANQKLKSDGYLFLNDVYESLGIPKTRAGQTVGWIYDEKNPIGDNCVDFGIYNSAYAPNRDFVNGYEPVILLDFNVDGDILYMIEEEI